jgi:hypothetical protein
MSGVARTTDLGRTSHEIRKAQGADAFGRIFPGRPAVHQPALGRLPLMSSKETINELERNLCLHSRLAKILSSTAGFDVPAKATRHFVQ